MRHNFLTNSYGSMNDMTRPRYVHIDLYMVDTQTYTLEGLNLSMKIFQMKIFQMKLRLC